MVLQGKRGIDDAADSKSFFFSLYLNESIRSFFSHTRNEEKKEEEREISTHIIQHRAHAGSSTHKKNCQKICQSRDMLLRQAKNVSSSLSRCCRMTRSLSSSSRKVKIVEVGPRDGLQNEPVLIDTDVRVFIATFRSPRKNQHTHTGKDRTDRQIS